MNVATQSIIVLWAMKTTIIVHVSIVFWALNSQEMSKQIWEAMNTLQNNA